MPPTSPTVEQHFEGKDPVVRPKKTSIHLNRRTAFAGVATRKSSLVLTLKAAKDLRSSRVKKHERASANRWHLEVPLTSPADVNAELVSWLEAAYEISG